MKTLRTMPSLALAAVLLAVLALPLAAATPKIQILVPEDNARLDAGEVYPLRYEVALGEGADHFHVWVDGERGPGIHDLKGVYNLPKMTAGEHVITLKLVDKGHVPTGAQKSIKVRVQ